MKNPNIFAMGRRPVTILLLLTFSLIFPRMAPVNGQPSLNVAPNFVYLGAGPGVLPVIINFFQGPVPWNVIAADPWLMPVPPGGVTPTPVMINYLPNPGPARIGTIIFQTPVPGIGPAILTVYQNQGLDPLMLHFDWKQITFLDLEPNQVPNTLRATFDYFPFPMPVFFNLIARTGGPQGQIAWLMRNVMFPDVSWIAGPQPLRLLADMSLLGYAPFQLVPSIDYSWTVSLNPEPAMPLYPDAVWMISPVLPEPVFARGRPLLQPYAAPPVTDYYSNILMPITVTDYYYIGCAMTNGDLDESSRSGEVNGCGPASAFNSLSWLANMHHEIDVPDNWTDGFNQISSLMRKRGESTNDRDFIRAKLDFIEMYDLPIKVKYQDDGLEGNINSTGGNSHATCQDGAPGAMPTKAWMISEAAIGEDVEVGVTYPGIVAGGHWVVLTGTVSINGKTFLFYKDDQNQQLPGRTGQGWTPIDETPGGMVVPGIGNAKIDIIVSESFDPLYVPVPGSHSYSKYCESVKRTLPPGGTIRVKYPENMSRCFNTSVRVYNHGTKDGYTLEAVWNHNSGKERKYVNNTGEPVTVEFHNDDHYTGPEPRLKSYAPYSVDLVKTFVPVGVTDPSNEETYAGFSIGSSDNSSDEFGEIGIPVVNYPYSIGRSTAEFPRRMQPAGCNQINISYPIARMNRYWKQLGLVIGVTSVAAPGTLQYSCPATGVVGFIPIGGPGEYEVAIGGVAPGVPFGLVLLGMGGLDMDFDNVGVPSLVQVSHTLDLKVLLEGAYNPVSGLMSTLLNASPQLIPLAQPYNVAPWNYAGTESVLSIPAGVVDWILVELRDAATPAGATSATKLAGWPRAFFLKSDGSVTDLDGTSQPDIGLPVIIDSLFVVIRHRNHLAIMSATGVPLTSGVYSYDFTTGLAQAYGGGSGYKMAGSKAVMVVGDMDHDGSVFISDYNVWAAGFGSTLGYYDPDLDMDGNVFVSDYNRWAANFGSFVPINIKSALIKPKYFSCVPK